MTTGYSKSEKMDPWVSKSEGKGTKSEPRDTKSDQKGPKGSQKGAKSEPAGAKSDPKSGQREPKVSQMAPKMGGRGEGRHQNGWSRREAARQKAHGAESFLAPFSRPFRLC